MENNRPEFESERNDRMTYGNYEVIKAVGKGKFAVVYRAQSTVTGEVVALKRINVDTIDDRARDKCLKECNLLSSLDHPNIVKYLDSFISEHDLVIVVEWAGAGDLKRQIRKAQEKNITFDEHRVWKYFKQVAAAMQHMHERRIMHRDLKPANIFLTTDGTLKVGDFGLSRELSETTIQAHSKVGTPLYMSPEVLRGVGYDFKSDIWSLGCLLYELCMLKSPFKSEGLNLMSLFHKIASGDFQPVSDNYSVELGNLVLSMLSNNPEDRPEIGDICDTANSLYAASKNQISQSTNQSINNNSNQIAESKNIDEITTNNIQSKLVVDSEPHSRKISETVQSKDTSPRSPFKSARSKVEFNDVKNELSPTGRVNSAGNTSTNDDEDKTPRKLRTPNNAAKRDLGNLSGEKTPKSTHSQGTNRDKKTNSNYDVKSILLRCNGTIETTQSFLNPIITRPKLTDKLLSKPPFRFLHDLIMELIRATGYAENLFTESEKDGAAITEKQAKIDFLDKIIQYVESSLKVSLEVKSAKIVSGLETEYTNTFLQHLAIASEYFNHNNQDDIVSPPSLNRMNSEPNKSSDQDREHRDQTVNNESDKPKFPNLTNNDRPSSAYNNTRPSSALSKQKSFQADEAKNDSNQIIKTSNQSNNDISNKISQCNGTIETTQSFLNPIITRPKLTDKLLSKPPFRFLHDLIMELIRATGYAENLFTESEKDGAAITEKQAKIDFLDKIIQYVESSLKVTLEVKSAKIVSGLEAEYTNTFLQHLAIASTSLKNVEDLKIENKLKLPANNAFRSLSPDSTEAQPSDRSNTKESSPHSTRTPPTGTANNRNNTSISKQGNEYKNDISNESKQIYSQPTEENSLRSTRPSTAGRRPPPVKELTVTVAEANIQQIISNDARVSPVKVNGIIRENDNDDEDDVDDVNNNNNNIRLADEVKNKLQHQAEGKHDHNIQEKVESKLVKDILSRQAEQSSVQNNNDINDNSPTKKNPNGNSNGIRLVKRSNNSAQNKGNDNINNNINNNSTISSSNQIDTKKLMDTIQSLTRDVGPMGTCLEYLTEDVEIMARETRLWEEDIIKYTIKFDEEQKNTNKTIIPLQHEVNNINDQIFQKILEINNLKRNIALNDEKIYEAYKKMLS